MSGGVLFLDDNDELREIVVEMSAAISGRPCLGLRSVCELQQKRDLVLDCELAVLDINLGPGEPSGLDAYAWLVAERFKGRIVFLTGHAKSDALVERAYRLHNARVFQKPLDFGALQDLLGGQRAGDEAVMSRPA
jgi:ActR/RegA family two-component response regulator